MQEFITKENKETLEKELHELTAVKRPEIIATVEYAKSLGDLSENAEYHAAREAQGKLEERIAQIEYVLKHAVIANTVSDGSVAIGTQVTIQKDGENDTRTFSIVGSEETDMSLGKLSYKSPLGRALLGKRAGEQARAMTPRGEMMYLIVAVE
ncbi:transcription elongation factor GreA [Candidatus Nomurabacteria bacterium]|nr:transcription elongation factor GreA [Candidatus Nomurabacteria bacterium]